MRIWRAWRSGEGSREADAARKFGHFGVAGRGRVAQWRGVPISPSELGGVVEVFERNFLERGELGASVSIWSGGEEVLSLHRGWRDKQQQQAWTADTIVPVYSATKGPSSACLLLALHDHGLGPETPVRELWPNFPVKEASFGDLLSHQCGLAVLEQEVTVWEHEAVVAAIERQLPRWRPGSGHGYHPRTFGALVEHPVRLLSGRWLGEFWRERIAEPLELDFWIGLPESEFGRVARLYPGKIERGELATDAFYRAYQTKGTITRDAFRSPRGLEAVHEMNEPRAWQAGFAAMGGIGSASALARFYQAALGVIESPLPAAVREWLAERRVDGHDHVLLRPTSFTCGCQLDPLDTDGSKLRSLNGTGREAFGHPGAGGSHAFGDPENGVSFAYVMNQMDLSVLPGLKSQELVRALYGG